MGRIGYNLAGLFACHCVVHVADPACGGAGRQIMTRMAELTESTPVREAARPAAQRDSPPPSPETVLPGLQDTSKVEVEAEPEKEPPVPQKLRIGVRRRSGVWLGPCVGWSFINCACSSAFSLPRFGIFNGNQNIEIYTMLLECYQNSILYFII